MKYIIWSSNCPYRLFSIRQFCFYHHHIWPYFIRYNISWRLLCLRVRAFSKSGNSMSFRDCACWHQGTERSCHVGSLFVQVLTKSILRRACDWTLQRFLFLHKLVYVWTGTKCVLLYQLVCIFSLGLRPESASVNHVLLGRWSLVWKTCQWESFCIVLWCLGPQKVESHRLRQREWFHRTTYPPVYRCISYQLSFPELRSMDFHKLFSEFPNLKMCLIDQSQQFWCYFNDQEVSFLALDLCELYWANVYTPLHTWFINKTCMLLAPWVDLLPRCNQRALHRLHIP